MDPNSPGRSPSDVLPAPRAGPTAGPMDSPSEPPSEAQQQGIKFQKVLARFVVSRGTRPAALVGGVLVWLILYVLQAPQGWSIGLPGISTSALVVLGAFLGSVVVEGAVTLAGLVSNAPWLQHYWNLFEMWSKYKLERIPPQQYYEHGAVLDYQRLYGHIPPDARPETQAEFARHVVRWKMNSKQMKKRMVRKGNSHSPRTLGSTKGKPPGSA
jgi:hypothetical protein